MIVKIFAGVALVAATLSVAAAQTPPPPPPPPPPAPPRATTAATSIPLGSASISGIVTTTGTNPQPLSSAIVELRADGIQLPQTFVTDATGIFAFEKLPTGRFTIAVSKPGRPKVSYGASRPGRTGASILLKDNDHITNIRVASPAGAAITGRVLDQFGLPVQDARVYVGPIVVRDGETVMQFGSSGTTDDRGVFRIFGLAAGDYALYAALPSFAFSGTSIAVNTASEIDAAESEPTTPTGPTVAAPPKPSEVMMSLSYYPSGTSAAEATPIHVDEGQERSGIDVVIKALPASTVSGTLLAPDGSVPKKVTMSIVPVGVSRAGLTTSFARMDQPGMFSFAGLPPGRYVITARGVAADDDAAALLWAREDVNVVGTSIDGLRITLQRGINISGTVHFESASNATPPASARAALLPIVQHNDAALMTPDAAAKPDGTIAFSGVSPGRYRLNPSTTSTSSPIQWFLKSAMLDGHDVLDDAFDVGTADLANLSVVFTDQPTAIFGSLEDVSGRPAPDYYIIVFPADQKFWFVGSRRIKTARPGVEGKFFIRGLPPGEYRLGAVIDVQSGDWYEPSFLQQIVGASTSFTLGEGEAKSIPLKIGGGHN